MIYADSSNPRMKNSLTRLYLKNCGAVIQAAANAHSQNNWSTAESILRNRIVELFSFLAIMPSKISVKKPVKRKIIIKLFLWKQASAIIKMPKNKREKIRMRGSCFIL